MPSLLSRVGKGLISFGTGIPSSEIDNIRAGRDINQANARIAEVQATEAEQLPQQREAEAERQEQGRRLADIAFGDSPDAPRARQRLAIDFPELLDSVNKQAGLETETQRREAADFAFQLENTPPEQRDALIDQRVATLASQGRDAQHTASLRGLPPDEQDRAARVFQLSALDPEERLRQLSAQPENKGFTLSQGQTRFDDQGNVVASVEKPDPVPDPKDQAALRKQVRETARNLRKDIGVDDIARNAKAFAQAIERETGTSDTASIIAAAKVFDPGSVVREGEVDVIQRSDGIFGALQTQLGQTREGGQVLSAAQRSELKALVENQVKAAQQEFNRRGGIEIDGFPNVEPGFVKQQFSDPFADIQFDSDEPKVEGNVLKFDDGTTVTFK